MLSLDVGLQITYCCGEEYVTSNKTLAYATRPSYKGGVENARARDLQRIPGKLCTNDVILGTNSEVYFFHRQSAKIGPQNHQKIMTHSPICGSWVSGPRPFHMYFSLSRKPKNHLRRRVGKKSRALECVASSH
eukprot:sb/3474895/